MNIQKYYKWWDQFKLFDEGEKDNNSMNSEMLDDNEDNNQRIKILKG